jgi:hypothetical protein
LALPARGPRLAIKEGGRKKSSSEKGGGGGDKEMQWRRANQSQTKR